MLASLKSSLKPSGDTVSPLIKSAKSSQVLITSNISLLTDDTLEKYRFIYDSRSITEITIGINE